MKVAVTGTDERLAERLRGEGFDVVSAPVIRIEVIDGPPIHAERYDWILVTSRNAVEPLLQRLVGEPARVAAIGPGTAEALRARRDRARLRRRTLDAGRARGGASPAHRSACCFAAAEGARDVLVRELGAELRPALPRRRGRPGVVPGLRPGRGRVGLGGACASPRSRTDLACVTHRAGHVRGGSRPRSDRRRGGREPRPRRPGRSG